MVEANEKITVPMQVEYKPAWISWVASVTGCLNALGVACDLVDVAGFSGYAFHIGIHPDLCPSGPTVLDWDALNAGPRMLGRTTLTFISGDCYTDDFKNDRTRAHCRYAFEIAKREIRQGRPCVIWGAYVPEFAICVGIEGDSYTVNSFKGAIGQEQPPIKYDEINAPGGPYTLAFPTQTAFKQAARDRDAVINALKFFNFAYHPYQYGGEAYDLWIDSLKAKRAISFGNAYNAQCYAEGRRFAAEFVKRLAERNEFAAKELGKSAKKYGKAADAMSELAKLFPFPGEAEKKVDDEKIIDEAVDLLKEAREAELKAMKNLAKVAVMDWPKE